MSREVALPTILELVLLVQRGVTVVCSGFNVVYFAGYPARRWRRRISAWALSLLNLAILAQTLYLGLLPQVFHVDALRVLDDPELQLVVGTFPLLASMVISVLILVQWAASRRLH